MENRENISKGKVIAELSCWMPNRFEPALGEEYFVPCFKVPEVPYRGIRDDSEEDKYTRSICLLFRKPEEAYAAALSFNKMMEDYKKSKEAKNKPQAT